VRAHAPRPLLFISDLHLSRAIPRTVAAFEHFVLVTADNADSVFVLGDLFDYWVGDDTLKVDPFARRIAQVLHTLSERGIALYVMHGNRDFLLGKRFMQAAGAIWLPDPFVMTAFGARIVLAHGDALCTADHKYQTFRRVARCRAAQWLFLAWPLRWRRALAERMRMTSDEGRSRPPSPLYDVTTDGVAALFRSSKTTTMIHGHTHKPARHDEQGGTRWVLPDWDFDHGTRRGGYLRVDAEGIHAFPLD
jgi:UDP-2,3-diacylglucosamine hydrolase